MFRALRNLTRALSLARTLIRHDAADVLYSAGLPRPLLFLAGLGLGKSRTAAGDGRRLSAAAQEMGPAFVKFGQALSTRPDMVGAEIAADLGELRDRLPAFPGEIVRRTIADQLDREVEEMFASLEEQPVAAASIAQVHFGTSADGSHVAVKILRPGIEEKFARDIDLFLWVAEWLEFWQPKMRRLAPVRVVQTFRASAQAEMDLRLEAAAASELAENFEGDESFQVPIVDWARTQRRVLTTNRVGGIPIADKRALADAGRDSSRIVRNLLTAIPQTGVPGRLFPRRPPPGQPVCRRGRQHHRC